MRSSKQRGTGSVVMALGLVAGLSCGSALAAAPRGAWVVQQVYADNHPYAAAASNELATKMAKMVADPFSFYRGTDALFFADMSTRPPSSYATIQTGYTWLGGDAHVGNFEAVRDSAGHTVFAVADFDEGYLGQAVWDVRRLAASLVLAGRANGVSESNIAAAVNTLVGAYVDQMAAFKGSSGELSFKLEKANTTDVVDDTIDAALAKTRSDLLGKYTVVSGGVRRFQSTSTLVPVTAGTSSDIASAMAAYVSSIAASKRYAAGFYTVKDVRQRLGAGLGSLGRLRYYVLVEGAGSGTSDDVILEFKQAATSRVSPAAPGRLPASAYAYNEGNRVARTAKAQRLDADVLVGYTNVAGQAYYVHEKSPYQEDFDPSLLTSPSKLNTAATYLGQALASAHALADQDYDVSVVSYSIDKQVTDAITSKSGFKSEVSAFAFDYADQVEMDWEAFVDAYYAGTPLY